jgi:hypothetical protein
MWSPIQQSSGTVRSQSFFEGVTVNHRYARRVWNT